MTVAQCIMGRYLVLDELRIVPIGGPDILKDVLSWVTVLYRMINERVIRDFDWKSRPNRVYIAINTKHGPSGKQLRQHVVENLRPEKVGFQTGWSGEA